MAATMQKQQNQPQQANNVQQNTQEMEKLKKDLQATNVEKERFQAQLEMLVQELEKSQVRVIHSYFFITRSFVLILNLKTLIFFPLIIPGRSVFSIFILYTEDIAINF